MEIKLKKFYLSELSIFVAPSKWDIKYGFFNEDKRYQIKLPYQFYRGEWFIIDYECDSCKNTIRIEDIIASVIGVHKIDYVDTSYLSSLYHSVEFIELISRIFKLNGKDWGHFYGYNLKDKLYSAKCLYKKCPHCNAQYLATYYNIQGQPPERTNPATPDEFYIEEMAWVEFDEEEFFREMNKKD